MTEIKPTVSSMFLVPTLGIKKDMLRTNNLINGYVGDAQKEINYDNAVYLLFRPKDFDKFKDFVDGEYDRTDKILEDYDYSGGFVVLVYSLDPRFESDFDLIKRGKYSKTSKEFQEQFPKVVTVLKNNLHRENLSMQYRIFNRAPDLIKYWENKIFVDFTDEMEVWEGFDINKETLDINKIRDLI